MYGAMQTFLLVLWVQALARNVRGYLAVIDPFPVLWGGVFHPQKQLCSCSFAGPWLLYT